MVSAVSAAGLTGPAQVLPHQQKIQHSFGHHDVSQVEAHIGGPAANACHTMGAKAYATRGKTAFKSAPDLFTAAHETAHVIQQKGGLALSLGDGIGQPTDEHERHADAVANLVVQQRSAEHLLNEVTLGDGSVQLTSPVQFDLTEEEQLRLLNTQLVLARAHDMSDEDWTRLEVAATADPELVAIFVERHQAQQVWDEAMAEDPSDLRPSHDVNSVVDRYDEADRAFQEVCDELGQSPDELLEALESLPRIYVERGKELAEVQLVVNKEIARAERDRYRVDGGNPEDVEALRVAAAEIVNAAQALSNAQNAESLTRSDQRDTHLDVVGTCDLDDELWTSAHYPSACSDPTPPAIEPLRDQLREMLERYQLEFPILNLFYFGVEDYLEYPIDAELMATRLVEASDEELESLTGAHVQYLLDRADDAIAAIHYDYLHISHLPDICQLVEQELGISDNETLLNVIRLQFVEETLDEVSYEIYQTAIAITAALVASLTTGGLALVATIVSLAATADQAARSGERALVESAVQDVSIYSEIGEISEEDPDLFWLILDLLALGLDATAAVRVYRSVRATAEVVHAERTAESVTDLSRALEVEGVTDAEILSRVRVRYNIEPDPTMLEVGDFRFTEYYYTRLFSEGRPMPALVAREILDANEFAPVVVAVGRRPGQVFFLYRSSTGVGTNGWEMVYNPSTREVYHLQPITDVTVSPQTQWR